MTEKEWLIEAHKKGEISITDILEKKLISSFMPMSQHSFELNDEFQGLVPPVQPRMILIEGGIPEPYVKDWMDKLAGTGGMQFDAIKLSEKFAFSETSQQHGTMLQKLSYQRNQAKEQLVSIQNVKRAILNIESDLEKMGEQKQAFEDSDWDQVMGIFIDNYGGPDRSWTAFARNVPMVRMALTWFLRLKPEKTVPVKAFM
ncbi:MAG: hypothetical protein GOU99_03800, partial [Candidatus Altiarchaeota archaeon]|nr:hypothetical protein [Candidatus Altiarchaeota archaeon]